MATTKPGWMDILTNGDSQALWAKLRGLIARHSATRHLYPHGELTGERREEIFNDLTQDLFLRLLEKDRWRYYLANGYSDDRVEHELYRIEVPNYVSAQQRKLFPESFRLARRVSELIKTRPEFRLYPIPAATDLSTTSPSYRACRKMVLRVCGLSIWPLEKAIEPDDHVAERAKLVAYRGRDVRRIGRSSGSQIIIGNDELLRLIVEIFHTIDSPVTIRRIRSLALSKLAVEDNRQVSLDAVASDCRDDGAELPRVDLPDRRPTPLEVLLAKESRLRIEELAGHLLQEMRLAVRSKPKRFYKLLAVAWGCYFDSLSPSQTVIARQMNVSDSLVSHYRNIFDHHVRRLNLTLDEYVVLNIVLSKRIAALLDEKINWDRETRGRSLQSPPIVVALARAAAQSEGATRDRAAIM